MNWAESGRTASPMAVVEIADPRTEPFPGFDSFLISYDELQAVTVPAVRHEPELGAQTVTR